MNKKSFEYLLEYKKILWNDMVKITIINPFKKKCEFWIFAGRKRSISENKNI